MCLKFNKKKLSIMLADSLSYKSFDRASTLTFYLLFSIFPLVFLLLRLTSLLYIKNFNFISFLHTKLPKEIDVIINKIITQTHSYEVRGFLGVLIVLFSLWSVHNTVLATIRQFNSIYKRPHRKNEHIRQFLSSFKILFYFILIVFFPYTSLEITGFILSTTNKDTLFNSTILIFLEIFKHLALPLILFTFSSILFKTALGARLKFRKTIAGAITTSLLIILSTELFGYYIGSVNSYSSLYGGLGAAMLLVSWLYLLSYSLIVGCIINYNYYD